MADDAQILCDGTLVVFAPGEGDCELGNHCAVYDIRWIDHDAYMRAHHAFAVPGRSHVPRDHESSPGSSERA